MNPLKSFKHHLLTWVPLVLLVISGIALLFTGVYFTTQLNQRGTAVNERENAIRIARPFGRIQREVGRLQTTVALGAEAFNARQFDLQRALVESRYFDMDATRYRGRMTPVLLAIADEAEAQWAALQAPLEEWGADPSDESLRQRLLTDLAALELKVNEADNVHVEQLSRTSTNLEKSEEELSNAFYFGFASLLIFFILVLLNFYLFNRRLLQASHAQEQAEEANKIKSQFLANMSHELRTPLNAILNFTGFVMDGDYGEVNEKQFDALSKASQSSEHLLSLINDVLDLTKIEVGMMQLFIRETDLKEVLDGTVATTKGLIKGKAVDLNLEIDPNLPKLQVDKQRIRQVMLNLVSNAAKFTHKGSITISAQPRSEDVLITVRDTGIGIPPEDQKLVFEAFKQAKHDLNISGTGLGMAIAKHFVEAHGGRIWLESAVNKGTSVYVSLPLASEAASP